MRKSPASSPSPRRKPDDSASSVLRSPCPVAATLDLIGDKWTLLIVRDLLAGKTRYRELVASPEGIATNILAARLERLVSSGIVIAQSSSQRVGSLEYSLSERGRSLVPVLKALGDWGLAHVPGTEAKIKINASKDQVNE